MYLKDPNTGLPSVSLTLLGITFICAISAAALNMFGVVSSTSIFAELLYSCTALYFSRRVVVNGKLFSSEKAEKIIKKVE